MESAAHDPETLLLTASLVCVEARSQGGSDIEKLLRGDTAARVVAMGESATPELARILEDSELDGVTRFMAANVRVANP